MKRTALLVLSALLLPAFLFSAGANDKQAAANDKRLETVKDKKNMTSMRVSYLKLLMKDKFEGVCPVAFDILKNRKEDPKLRVICAEAIDAFDYKPAVDDLLRIVMQEGAEEDTGKPEDQEEDYDVRIACAKALAGFDDKEVVTQLGQVLGKLQDARGDVTDAIVDELMKSKFKDDDNVLAGCSLAIKHRKKEIREKVVKVLGAVNDKKALPFLMLGMEDKEPSVRILAIGFVAKLGGKLANVTLIDALEEEKDNKVREEIADELLKIEIGGLRKVWMDKLQSYADKDPSPAVKTKLKKAAERFKKGSTIIK